MCVSVNKHRKKKRDGGGGGGLENKKMQVQY